MLETRIGNFRVAKIQSLQIRQASELLQSGIRNWGTEQIDYTQVFEGRQFFQNLIRYFVVAKKAHDALARKFLIAFDIAAEFFDESDRFGFPLRLRRHLDRLLALRLEQIGDGPDAQQVIVERYQHGSAGG